MTHNKFTKIYDSLKAMILNQEIDYGKQLPSENELVERYQMSRETVRKALDLLATDGMIQKRRGKGSIVIYQGVTEFPVGDLISFQEVQKELELAYETKVILNEEIKAQQVPEVKQALALTNHDKLIHIIRTRQFNGKVKIIDEDYFLASIVNNIPHDIAQQSIYYYLENELDLQISYSSKTITFEPFTANDYRLFGNVSTPYSATVKGVVYLEDTTRFQFNISKHIATEFKFKEFSRRRHI